MRRVLIASGIVAVASLVATAVILKPGLFLPNTGDALGSSLVRQLDNDGEDGAGCTRVPDRDWWYCLLSGDPDSGYTNPPRAVRLDARRNGCWTARNLSLARTGRPAVTRVGKRTFSGCVEIRDYVVPMDVPGGDPTPPENPPD